eukprot:4242154-Ditylum_brightwellii.AAC.1
MAHQHSCSWHLCKWGLVSYKYRPVSREEFCGDHESGRASWFCNSSCIGRTPGGAHLGTQQKWFCPALVI